MKKRNTLFVMIAVVAVLFIWPAKVMVGLESVELEESIALSTIKNIVGDIKGFTRCKITGLNFYRRDINSLLYKEGRGMLISAYAARELKRLIKNGQEDLAYEISQNAFYVLQDGKWNRNKIHKLNRPLTFYD